MKLASIIAVVAFGSASAFSLPGFFSPRTFSKSPASSSPLFSDRTPVLKAEAKEITDEDIEDAASEVLAVLVVDAVGATKQLAINWGFVLNSGIVKAISGILAFSTPILATEVAYNIIGISLAFVSVFNIAGLFFEKEGLKIWSLLLGIAQAALAFRMNKVPFEALNVMTMLIAGIFMADGAYEAAVAVCNSDLPGRWALFSSGMASIIGGAFVAVNLPVASLFVLGTLFALNLFSSGLASIFTALKGREIANVYLESANFEKDAFEAIAAVAEAA